MTQELQLTICDLRDDCVAAALKRFAGIKSVVVRKTDITRLSVKAFATAGNSFGDMGGGVAGRSTIFTPNGPNLPSRTPFAQNFLENCRLVHLSPSCPRHESLV